MIYFIEAVGAGLLKIGYTDREPEQRLRELQTGCPHKLRLVGYWEEPADREKYHHEQWGHLRTNGEWFRIDDRLRGYLWWLEFCKPYTDGEVSCVRGDVALAVLPRLGRLDEYLDERVDWLTDQIHRLWQCIGIMNGWPDGVERPGDTLAVIPRSQPTRAYADCRM